MLIWIFRLSALIQSESLIEDIDGKTVDRRGKKPYCAKLINVFLRSYSSNFSLTMLSITSPTEEIRLIGGSSDAGWDFFFVTD